VNRYLVEEHRARTPYGDEYVHDHFMYHPDELIENTAGYLWVAADGSDCLVEVRDLGPVAP